MMADLEEGLDEEVDNDSDGEDEEDSEVEPDSDAGEDDEEASGEEPELDEESEDEKFGEGDDWLGIGELGEDDDAVAASEDGPKATKGESAITGTRQCTMKLTFRLLQMLPPVSQPSPTSMATFPTRKLRQTTTKTTLLSISSPPKTTLPTPRPPRKQQQPKPTSPLTPTPSQPPTPVHPSPPSPVAPFLVNSFSLSVLSTFPSLHRFNASAFPSP